MRSTSRGCSVPSIINLLVGLAGKGKLRRPLQTLQSRLNSKEVDKGKFLLEYFITFVSSEKMRSVKAKVGGWSGGNISFEKRWPTSKEKFYGVKMRVNCPRCNCTIFIQGDPVLATRVKRP